MAIMKIKNDAGEWVSGAPVNFLHQFKFAFVEPTSADGSTTTRLLDLSPYVQKNSDFMLIMRPDHKSSSGLRPVVYIHSDGQIRCFSSSTATSNVSTLNNVFDLDTAYGQDAFEYDPETRIMTYKYSNEVGKGFNTSLLIYAG